MSTSTARLEANRRNALKSTGPKTAAGKAASRLNAFQHGHAGQGDLAGPGDDLRLVAQRAEAFGRELQASGAMGLLLAHRAALLSVRMESLAAGEQVAVRAAEQQGRAAFDADRLEAIADLLRTAEATDADPAPALAALAESPDGLARLIAVWGDLLVRLGSSDPGSAPAQVARWLGDPQPAAALDDLAPRAAAEVERLQALALTATMTSARRAIDQARTDAGIVARFDPSPEAALARRYEAAAERGMYRAIRTIAALNRDAGPGDSATGLAAEIQATLTALGRSPSPVAPRPPASAPAPLPALSRADRSDPLGSFRAAATDLAPWGAPPLNLSAAGAPTGPEPRQPRPDLRKLDRKRAGNRR